MPTRLEVLLHKRKSARAGVVDAHNAGMAKVNPNKRGRIRRKTGNRTFAFGIGAGYLKRGLNSNRPAGDG